MGCPLPRVDLFEGFGGQDVHVARPFQVEYAGFEVDTRFDFIIQVLDAFYAKIYSKTEPAVFVRQNGNREGDGEILKMGGIDRGQTVILRACPVRGSWFETSQLLVAAVVEEGGFGGQL